MKAGMVLIIITPNDPLRDFCYWARSPGSQRITLLLRDTPWIPLNYMSYLSLGHSGFLVFKDQRRKVNTGAGTFDFKSIWRSQRTPAEYSASWPANLQ